MTDLQRRPAHPLDDEFDEVRDALIVAVFAHDREELARWNALPSSYPPVWNRLNPWSPAVWIVGYLAVSAVFMAVVMAAYPPVLERLLWVGLFVVASLVFCVVFAAQRPCRLREYGCNPDLRAAWRAGWRTTKAARLPGPRREGGKTGGG